MSAASPWQIARRSHHLLSLFRARSKRDADDAVFLTFRPVYIKAQLRVYRAAHQSTCSICMLDWFPESLANQHDPKHPPICATCYARLTRCPFCRAPLFPTLLCFLVAPGS